MNIERFSVSMESCLRILETENLYRKDGKMHPSQMTLVAAWDDGRTYQIVIEVRAGEFSGLAGYTEEWEPPARKILEDEDIELSYIIRRNGMYGDGILGKLEEASNKEILWRYTFENGLTPRTLEEVAIQTANIDRWLNPSYFSSDMK